MRKIIKITENQLASVISKNISHILSESAILNTIEYNGHTLTVKNYDMNLSEDKEYIKSQKNKIWAILNDGYKKLGGFKGFQTINDMVKKSPFFRLGFCDDELVTVTVYNGYLGGSKCVGATCVKNDKHEPAVKLLEMIIKYNIENWNQWVWIEASGKIEEMCKKNNAFNVPSEYAILYLKNIPYNDIDEFHYSRMISGNMETKTIFGFKDSITYEIIKDEINKKVDEFINKINKSKIDESLSKRGKIYQKYLEKCNKLDKYKDIIDYFVYLKDDELINEFPQESLDILKNTIYLLKTEIKNNKQKKDLKYYKMAIEEGLRVLNTSTVLYPIAI